MTKVEYLSCSKVMALLCVSCLDNYCYIYAVEGISIRKFISNTAILSHIIKIWFMFLELLKVYKMSVPGRAVFLCHLAGVDLQ